MPVLEEFLDNARLRGERIVALARLIFASFGLVRTFVFGGWEGLLNGSPKYFTAIGGLLLGLAWSVWVLVYLRPGRKLRRALAVSVVADAVLLLTVGLSIAAWPSPTYPGLLRIAESGLFLLAMAAPGLRLSRRVAATGALLIAVAQLILFVVDYHVVPERITYGASEFVMWFALNLGSFAFGWAIAANARRLVFRGAEAALSAERARQRLGLYVSEEVAREALESDVLEIGGRRQRVAVLFSDLRDFTRYCEGMPPEQLVSELNEYLDTMVRVIRDHGGVVDKFIGDAIMAVFGIPTEHQDSAQRAVVTAAAMQRALAELNERRAARGRPPLRQGVGVHFGEAVAGNIGNSERLQYTVVGSVVNLASRLETATKTLGVPVVISAETAASAREHAPALALRSLGLIEVRGYEGPVEVFTLDQGAAAQALPMASNAR
ncbi:MAG: adenylate/guanylate cyclase domain-containing protein [Myxococcales bacterium]